MAASDLVGYNMKPQYTLGRKVDIGYNDIGIIVAIKYDNIIHQEKYIIEDEDGEKEEVSRYFLDMWNDE